MSSKWAKLAKCAPDTALRDMIDMLEKKILFKEQAGGRSTSYVLRLSQERVHAVLDKETAVKQIV